MVRGQAKIMACSVNKSFIIGGGVTVDNYEEYANLTGTNFVHGTKIIAK
jgi:copper homeostasis protein CutC